MALDISRLSGGTSPADGSDPRTFPTIWNATASALEALDLTDLTGVSLVAPSSGQVLTYDGENWVNQDTSIELVNTDDDPGKTFYVGSVDPDGEYALAAGDVWIQPEA